MCTVTNATRRPIPPGNFTSVVPAGGNAETGDEAGAGGLWFRTGHRRAGDSDSALRGLERNPLELSALQPRGPAPEPLWPPAAGQHHMVWGLSRQGTLHSPSPWAAVGPTRETAVRSHREMAMDVKQSRPSITSAQFESLKTKNLRSQVQPNLSVKSGPAK